MSKLTKFIRVVLCWSLGFVIAGYIFCATIFHVIPRVTGLPVDTAKYAANASRQISVLKMRETEEPPGPALSETVLAGLNNAVDYLVKLINGDDEP